MCAFCSAWNIPNKCPLVQRRDYGSNWLRGGIMATDYVCGSGRHVWCLAYMNVTHPAQQLINVASVCGGAGLENSDTFTSLK